MDLEKLEQNVQKLVDDLDEESFIYDLLLAYDFPKATITRLKNGDRNQSKKSGEIIWKKNLCFTDKPDADLFTCIDALKSDPAVTKHHPRFIVVTDYMTFLAIDTKTGDSLDIPIKELPKRANFFLPWAGMEKSAITSEKLADIKAAEKMGQLYELLLQNNEIEDKKSWHALNVFLSRLLFCFFAEDTCIFEGDQFTKLIDSHTVEDGSNIQSLLGRLFRAFNTEDRSDYPDYIKAFPYVNGGLFADELPVPVFSRKSRKLLIDCGSLNWKAINPDIFGSMMQAVTHGEERSSIGMHYTSVVNIMKVIEPLFLNDMREELEKADGNEKKLEKLLDRLYHLRVFDPACGSGNFLIITYKELCRLEIEIFQQLQELNPSKWSVARSGIQLNQLFGIEIDDFAAETARLSLWLAEHQMNLEFEEVFGRGKPTLPLENSGNIVRGNATRVIWSDVCPGDDKYEVLVLGNPPYLGGKKLSVQQSEDMSLAGLEGKKRVDYVGCWFFKSVEYSEKVNAKFAFVATSSICQGEQVHLLWPHLFESGLEISFAYKPFRWTNSAKGNAGVYCVIVGLQKKGLKYRKPIFSAQTQHKCAQISPYLFDYGETVVFPSTKPINGLPEMCMGSNPVDGKHLICSESEYRVVVRSNPNAKRFLKRYMGGNDFLRGTKRYCIWVNDDDLPEAIAVPFIRERIEACKNYRRGAGRDARKVADTPHKFCYRTHKDSPAIILPNTSSSARSYVPASFTDNSIVINKEAFAIYDVQPFVFGLISSSMHKVWLEAVGGRLGEGYRYSVKLVYNTFPVPEISKRAITSIEEQVFSIIDLREKYSERTIYDLYGPDGMPDELRESHVALDVAVESAYRKKPFKNNLDRLKLLFDMYKMSGQSKAV